MKGERGGGKRGEQKKGGWGFFLSYWDFLLLLYFLPVCLFGFVILLCTNYYEIIKFYFPWESKNRVKCLTFVKYFCISHLILFAGLHFLHLFH